MTIAYLNEVSVTKTPLKFFRSISSAISSSNTTVEIIEDEPNTPSIHKVAVTYTSSAALQKFLEEEKKYGSLF